MTEHLAKLIETAGRPRILVVGDLILDKYIWGEADRISPEGPIPILLVTSEETRPGGGGNVVSALTHLGADVSICGVIGRDVEGDTLATQLQSLAASADGVFRDDARPTTVKTRYIGYVQSARRGIQHMLRVDREDKAAVSGHAEKSLLACIEKTLPRQDVVILSDYNKGVLTEALLARTIELAKAQGIPVVTDPKIGRDYRIYRGTSVLTPNRYEAQVATGVAPRDEESLRAAACALVEMADLRHVVITLDRDGMYLYGKDEKGVRLTTRPREVMDVTGAGDIVASLIAFVLACGGRMRDAVMLANVAAGIAVTKIGAAPVSRGEILADLLGAHSMNVKLKTIEEAVQTAGEVRRRNGKVVWTNGCFDILHIGHYEYLKFAKQQGDLLVVGLNSDDSVRRVKGPGRPITGEAERARILAALDVVDCIVIFDEDTPVNAIAAVGPDVLVKGGEYRKEQVVGWEIVESYGGRVVLAPHVEGVSTTDIVQRIVDRYRDKP